MGIFDDIKPVIGNNTRNGFFPCVEATYKVRIEQCKNKKASENSGEAFIVEMEVLESNCDEVSVGDFKDWYRSTDGKTGVQRKMAAQDIATFLCAASGYDPDSAAGKDAFDKAHPNLNHLLLAAGDDNALADRVLTLRTYPKKTRAGGDFTVHVWGPEGAAAPAPATAAPTPTVDRSGWRESPDGRYLLDPAKNQWVLR